MATLGDLRKAALALPEVVEGDGERVGWSVRGKAFAWERPLRPKDLAELDLERQPGTVVCLRCTHDQKAELTASEPEVFFATSHFNNYPAVLVWLDRIGPDELLEAVTDAWLVQAPKRLAKAYLAERELGQ